MSSDQPPLPSTSRSGAAAPVTLSSPPMVVHVLGRTQTQEEQDDEDQREVIRRDSLETTRNFYNIPSKGSTSSSFGPHAAASSRPVSPPPRPSSRQNSIRSLHDLSSPQLSLSQPPVAPSYSVPSSNTFTSGVLPPRGFFAPQPPRGAQAAAEAAAARRNDDFELSRVGRGFGGSGRRGAESEDEQDESEAEGSRGQNGSRLSLNAGGGGSREGGGRGGFTSSREPLISSTGNGRTTPNLLASSPSQSHTSPFGPPHPHFSTQQAQPHMSPSASSQAFSSRTVNPPPPLSFSSALPTHNHSSPHLSASPYDGEQPSTSFTPPATPRSPTGGKKRYNYQNHGANNSFFLRGRLLTGGDSPIPFIVSLALVLGLGGLWLGTTGVWMWRDGVGGNEGRGGIAVVIIFAWIWGVALGGMFGTAFRDPGIIPRNLDLAPPLTTTVSTSSLVPLPRDIRVRAGRVTVKYCETCRIYRPPRSSHCRVCGNCVDGIDHHCTYLHTCVGRRNYTSFMSFLVFTFLALVYTVVFSAVHLWRLTRNGQASNFKQALGQNAGSGVSFILGVLLVLPVGLLMSYHLRLMMKNSTTIEEIRRSATQNITPRPASPFAVLLFWRARTTSPKPLADLNGDNPNNPFAFRHWYTNLGRMLCRPAIPSWMDFDREIAEVEEDGQHHGGEKWRRE